VNAPEPVAQFVAAVGPRPEERAIDVACGPGLLARSCLRCDGRSWWRRGARGDIRSIPSTRGPSLGGRGGVRSAGHGMV